MMTDDRDALPLIHMNKDCKQQNNKLATNNRRKPRLDTAPVFPCGYTAPTVTVYNMKAIVPTDYRC